MAGSKSKNVGKESHAANTTTRSELFVLVMTTFFGEDTFVLFFVLITECALFLSIQCKINNVIFIYYRFKKVDMNIH